MNIAEAQLMDNSLQGLTQTLLQKRMIDERSREAADRTALDREMMGLRERDLTARSADQDADRKLREREVTAREGTARSLEQYRKDIAAAKSEDEKLELLKDLFKSGLVDEQGKAAFEAELSKKMGVPVKLQLPEVKKFDTREGHNLKLAETYRKRAAEARARGASMQGPAADGGVVATPAAAEESARFQAIAERLERGGGAADDEDAATITEEIKAAGAGPLEEGAKVTRKVPRAKLDEEMARLRGGSAAPAAGAGKAFESESAARAAGHKAGDIVQLMINGKATRVRLK